MLCRCMWRGMGDAFVPCLNVVSRSIDRDRDWDWDREGAYPARVSGGVEQDSLTD